MLKARRHDPEKTYPHSYLHWMPEEKKKAGDDLVRLRSGRSDSGGREKTSCRTGVLSLSGSSMSKDGKEEKESGGVF